MVEGHAFVVESVPMVTPMAAPTERAQRIDLGGVARRRRRGRTTAVAGILLCGMNTPVLTAEVLYPVTPSWSGPTENTQSVALGDVDGDGDLDLVRGNDSQGTTLYLNIGGTFAASPTWVSPSARTFSVVLGDVDGDTDLDLVCGDLGGGASLYVNSSGTFGDSAAWKGPAEFTRSLALGDVDGDGDLDLVCGNDGQGAALYLNVGGTFAKPAAWRGPPEATFSVALGDVDGDGDLDLVRGNYATGATGLVGTTLYLNIGGTFAGAPSWTGPLEQTFSAMLADVDSDGDLDLVCGNDGQGATFYPNSGGTFALTPAWTGTIELTTSLALGDVDGDGDLDLVRGNYAQGATLYLSHGGTFASSPAWVGPVVHANSVRMGDVDGDGDLDLVFGNFREAATLHSNLLFRPEMSTLPSELVFPTVTLGDSAETTLSILNTGNRDLVIDQLDSQDTEVVVQSEAGFIIPPGQTQFVSVVLAPRLQKARHPIRVYSNDPLARVLEIPLNVDIRPLQFGSQLLSLQSELPLGVSVVVRVTPAAQVRVEQATVFYRAAGDQSFETVPLESQGQSFTGVIPGDRVTEAGLECFISVENSGIRVVDPVGAPDSTLRFAVAPPSAITTYAEPETGGDYPTDRATPIVLTLPLGTLFERGTVFFRPGGRALYDSVDFANPPPMGNRFGVVIPAQSIGPRGLEYWVSVHTRTRMLTDPAQEPAAHPKLVRIRVDHLQEQESHAGGHYRMVAVPLDIGVAETATVEAILQDEPEFGPYDPTRWRSFRWRPADGTYVEISAGNAASGFLRPEPGRAFWLIAKDANRIDTAPVSGRSTLPGSITLQPGWNQVGSPYAYRVAWSKVSATGPSGPVTLEPPVGWNEVASHYEEADVTVLEPFVGYWVRNRTADPVELIIPPIEAASMPRPAGVQAMPDTSAWSIQIKAACGVVSESRSFAGVAATALERDDALDRSEPPMAPGDALSLYFVGSEPGTRRSYDVRPTLSGEGDPASQGWSWAFDLIRSAGEVQPAEASLSFVGLEHVPTSVELRLLDRTLGRTIDVRREGTYRYVASAQGYVTCEEDARFELRAGTREYVEAARTRLSGLPEQTRLLVPYPNPLAGTSLVRYELARAGRMRLEVYDSAGRRMRTLVEGSREAGRYELAWSGGNDAGRRLPPGIYLLRLAGPDRADTRKVVLVR